METRWIDIFLAEQSINPPNEYTPKFVHDLIQIYYIRSQFHLLLRFSPNSIDFGHNINYNYPASINDPDCSKSERSSLGKIIF